MSVFLGYYTGIKKEGLPPHVSNILSNNLYNTTWVLEKNGKGVSFFGGYNDVSIENKQEKKLLEVLDKLKPLIDVPLEILTYKVYNDYCELINSIIYNEYKINTHLNSKLKIWRQ